jgi:hypothetical protein
LGLISARRSTLLSALQLTFTPDSIDVKVSAMAAAERDGNVWFQFRTNKAAALTRRARPCAMLWQPNAGWLTEMGAVAIYL